MRSWGKRGLGLAGVAICGCLALAPSAWAGDPNSAPAHAFLSSAGDEGIVGPRSEALAYFSTEDLEGDLDRGGEYTRGSRVSFSCSIDGAPVRCRREFIQIEEGAGELLRPAARGSARRAPHGTFDGYVPVPPGLAAGPHTISVLAADEDGTDPSPASVSIVFDSQPPSAPELVLPPHRSSRIHRPAFRVRASDDLRLVRPDADQFRASLRRLSRPRWVLREDGGEPFLDGSTPSCPSLTTCASSIRAYFIAPGPGSFGIGLPLRLSPGFYRFRVGAIDAAGNRSPVTAYGFRILPPPRR